MTLKIGDVVQLKSGGPRMTVQSVADAFGDPVIQCSWFVTIKGNQKLENGAFHPDSLVKVDDRGGAIGLQF